MTHTPGPFKVMPKSENGTFTYAIVKEIYEGDPASSYCVAWTVDALKNGEDLANAHLFAAAPEMLSALKDIFRMLDEGILVRDISKDNLPEWAGLALGTVTRLKFAADATAKAELGRVK